MGGPTCRLEGPLALPFVMGGSLHLDAPLRLATSRFSVGRGGRFSVGLLSGFRLQSSTEFRSFSSRVMSSKLASFSVLAPSRDNDRQDDELLFELLL